MNNHQTTINKMFELHHYYDWKKGNKKTKYSHGRKVNLFSIHFKRLGGYNKDWKLQHILIYEYMLICARKYGHKNFTQITSMITEATFMSKDTVFKYIEKFENEGFIKVKRKKSKGTSRFNRYTIDYECIKDSLEKIYNFGNMKKKDIEDRKKELCKWYDYHSSSSYRDASKGTSGKKGKHDPASDSVGTSITSSSPSDLKPAKG